METGLYYLVVIGFLTKLCLGPKKGREKREGMGREGEEGRESESESEYYKCLRCNQKPTGKGGEEER